MLRRLHSRIIGLGSICGMTRASSAAEVFLKTLPLPQEVDLKRYERFEREEEIRTSETKQGHRDNSKWGEKAPEPFFDVVGGAAGHKHVVLLLSTGNLVTFGDNKYGQTGSPLFSKEEDNIPAVSFRSSGAHEAHEPLYIDLSNTLFSDSPLTDVECGSNYSFVYAKGTRHVIAFGNNHMGQLGCGHKKPMASTQGFYKWDTSASWWPKSSSIDSIVSGFNHSVVRLSDGSLYAFGSNTWGELGIGSTISPMFPTRITFFERRGIQIKKVALGNSFSLFLTVEGRVYGCGATDEGQVPKNTFDPVIIPLGRHFVRSAESAGRVSREPSDPKKLIRIKDIACVGSLAVYLTTKNEILLQGGYRDYGFSVPSPRIHLVMQDKAVNKLKDVLGDKEEEVKTGFRVQSIHSGPQTMLLRYQNGCVGGVGCNAEQELFSSLKCINGRNVNVAEAFSFNEVFPVLSSVSSCCTAYTCPWIMCGKGFTLIVDPDSSLKVRENVPLELPASEFTARVPRNTRYPSKSR